MGLNLLRCHLSYFLIFLTMAADKTAVVDVLRDNHAQFLASQAEIHQANMLLHTDLQSVGAAVLTQSALSSVPLLTNQANISAWLEDIDKHVAVHGLNDAAVVNLAWARCKGTISSFIRRYREEHSTVSWSLLKSELVREFGDEVDEEQAISKFTSLRQRKDEDITSYTERLLKLGRRAYRTEWNSTELHKKQAKAVFMDGLRSLELKKEIYGKKPETLEAAIELAKADDMANRRFDCKSEASHRHEVPMEVEHQRHHRCFHCGGPHSARQCRKGVNTVRSQPRLTQLEKDRRERLCYICHKPGHFAAACRSRPRN